MRPDLNADEAAAFYTARHDFKNALLAIMGAAELLAEPDACDPAALIETIRTAARVAARTGCEIVQFANATTPGSTEPRLAA